MSVYCTTSDLPVLRKQNNAAKHNHAEPGIIILMFGCPLSRVGARGCCR